MVRGSTNHCDDFFFGYEDTNPGDGVWLVETRTKDISYFPLLYAALALFK